MRIELSSRFFTVLGSLVNDGGRYDITLRHQAALDAMPTTGEWQPQSLSASQIVLARPGGYTLTLAGSGISPVSSLNDLAAAIDAGIATGTFSSLTLRQNSTELARLTFQPGGWTLTSDTLSVALTGATPTTLQQLIAIAQANANAWADPQALQTLLNTYAITGLSVVNAGTELLGLSLTAGAVTLRVPGATGTLTGTFATRLGDVLAAVGRAQDAAGWQGDWTEILLFEEFQAGTLTIRDTQGATILSVSEATQPWQQDAYFLIEPQQWVSRSWLDMHWDALVAGTIAFPATTPGNDRITVTSAPALVISGAGNDTVTTGDGDDTILGNDGSDFIQSRGGNDYVEGGWGNDTIWAGAGDDAVWVLGGNNEVWAGPGNDTLTGGSGDDILGGGAGDDYIYARAGGRNQLWGGDGRDTLHTGDNGDAAGGGWGDDIVHGGAGGDTLMGGLGNDTVQGEGGDDRLFLGMGSDMGYGGAGNDTLVGGPGFDRLWGGAGADRFEFWRDAGWNRVEDFAGGEGDVLALGRGMQTGTHGVLTAAQVVSTFGTVNAAGDAVLNFAAAGTTVVVVGAGTLAGLEDHILIL